MLAQHLYLYHSFHSSYTCYAAKTYECAAVTAALTSVEFDNATLPIHLELDGFIISRYSFVVGGTISPLM